MTAKEKAIDLVNKFTWERQEHEKYVAKEIAKTHIEEIIKILDGLHKPEYTCFDIYEPKQFTISGEVTDGYMLKAYFEEVIAEIKKL